MKPVHLSIVTEKCTKYETCAFINRKKYTKYETCAFINRKKCTKYETCAFINHKKMYKIKKTEHFTMARNIQYMTLHAFCDRIKMQ